MSTSTETNIKRSEVISQSSQAMPATNKLTVDEIKSWNTNELLEWIQQNLGNPLDKDDKELFLEAKIDGAVFLEGAGNKDFFLGAGLSFGASVRLAGLAKETIGKKRECCCSTSYTLCRQTSSPTSCTLRGHPLS